MTAIADAFGRAGLSKRQMCLWHPLREFVRQGGTEEELIAAFRAVKKLSGEGQKREANGHDTFALARQPNGSERGNAHLSQDLSRCSQSLPPKAGGAGQDLGADKATTEFPPAREPSQQQKAAALRVAQSLAVTVLDTYKIEGRAVGDWTVGEALHVGRIKSVHGHILSEAARVVANAKHTAKLREVVKPREMERIIRKANGVDDAA